jgi:alpha-acetolactate decarboxylase
VAGAPGYETGMTISAEARKPRLHALVVSMLAVALGTGVAMAQHMPPGGGHAPQAKPQPFGIATVGAFRNLILEGDFSAKTTVGHALRDGAMHGVGALADARGEITILDGDAVISYGMAGAHPAPTEERAALLAVSSVKSWQTIAVDRDVEPAELENFLDREAAAHGIDAATSFPFRLRGTLIAYAMHVNAAPTNGPHGMGQPVAVAIPGDGDEIAGEAVGLYVAPELVGIATHGGERTHSHWVAQDRGATAHLDRWGIKAGAVLMLPAAIAAP